MRTIKSWEPTRAKAVLAVGVPIAALVLTAYYLIKIEIGPLIAVLVGDWLGIAKLIAGLLALTFWIVRYTIPSIQLLRRPLDHA
ncbi:hypothetical protein A6F68_01483 [Tsuneonella dongtanensis]|uniref:Uncharacterized protein n=1 Tax=Tsuneonella dongtanensis TaxID=692370 RepID=A0A1B2ACX0_9SPHN|nr:hypothetical protein A6F68_01483 [Tsuneonella dongtanensis]